MRDGGKVQKGKKTLLAVLAGGLLCFAMGCTLPGFTTQAPPDFSWQVRTASDLPAQPEVTPVPLPQGFLGPEYTVRYEEDVDLDGDGEAERLRICWQTGLRAGMYLCVEEAVAQLPPNTPWNYICTLVDLDQADEFLEIAVYEVDCTLFYRYMDGVFYEMGELYGCLAGQKGLQNVSIFPDGNGEITVQEPAGSQSYWECRYAIENHRLVPMQEPRLMEMAPARELEKTE